MKRWLIRLGGLLFSVGLVFQAAAQDASAPPASSESPPAVAPAVEQPAPAAPIPVPTIIGPTPVPEKVEATVEQIEQLINAPPAARLGREVDEPEKPTALFGDPSRISELLGEEPRYVYIPMGNDPMIVPWVRESVMVNELLQEAMQLMNEGQLELALTKVRTILERFPRTDAANKAQDLKSRIEQALKKTASISTDNSALPQGTQRPFPQWITDNTRGVVLDVNDPTASSVLIGDFVLRVGDTIPDFPGITIKSIEKGVVVFSYQGELTRLQVEGR